MSEDTSEHESSLANAGVADSLSATIIEHASTIKLLPDMRSVGCCAGYVNVRVGRLVTPHSETAECRYLKLSADRTSIQGVAVRCFMAATAFVRVAPMSVDRRTGDDQGRREKNEDGGSHFNS